MNSLTYVFVSGGYNFFQISLYFIMHNFLEWFEILKILMMTLFRNQCNTNTKDEFWTLQSNLDKAGMLYSGHLSVVCKFSLEP